MTDKSDATGSLEDIVNYVDETYETTIDFNGDTYWFKYKNSIPSRIEQNIVLQYASTDNVESIEDADVKAGDLQVALLEEYIVDSSVDKLSTLLKKAPSEFIDPLAEEILDNPLEAEEEKGN